MKFSQRHLILQIPQELPISRVTRRVKLFSVDIRWNWFAGRGAEIHRLRLSGSVTTRASVPFIGQRADYLKVRCLLRHVPRTIKPDTDVKSQMS